MSAVIVILVFVLYLASRETYTFNVEYALYEGVIYIKLLELGGKQLRQKQFSRLFPYFSNSMPHCEKLWKQGYIG